jgi:hypothetical protein
MRVLILAICAVVAGCSIAADDNLSLTKYVPPSALTSEAQVKGLQRAITDEQLIGQSGFPTFDQPPSVAQEPISFASRAIAKTQARGLDIIRPSSIMEILRTSGGLLF